MLDFERKVWGVESREDMSCQVGGGQELRWNDYDVGTG